MHSAIVSGRGRADASDIRSRACDRFATLSWAFAFALIAATIAACSTDPNLPERSFATARD
jgi:hypothetical protein